MPSFITTARDIAVGYPTAFFPAVQEDDVVIAFVHVAAGAVITPQAGYTALEGAQISQSTGDLQVYWYRIPSTGTHTIGDFCADAGLSACAVSAWLVRGCNPSGDPVDDSGYTTGTGIPSGPTINPTGDGRAIIQFVTQSNAYGYIFMDPGTNPVMAPEGSINYSGYGLTCGYPYNGVQTTQAAYQRDHLQTAGAYIVYALALVPPPPPDAPTVLTASCMLPVAVSPAFTLDVNAGPAPLTVNCTDTSSGTPDTWDWMSGNGQTSASQNPTFVFTRPGTYEILLTASNAQGGGSVSHSVRVTDPNDGVNLQVGPPVADFSCDVTIGADPLTVTFTDLTTGTVDTWDWSWGDGTANGNTQNPSHVFNPSGDGPWEFVVILTATDSNTGFSSVASKMIFVTNGAPGTTTPPTAVITASETVTQPGVVIDFTCVVTNGPATYAWEFGDGGVSEEEAPSHTYLEPGTYTVRLTVSNLYGSTSSTIQIIVFGFLVGGRGRSYYYIVDTPNDRVLVYHRANGNFYGHFGEFGLVIPGRFSRPTTLYVDRGLPT